MTESTPPPAGRRRIRWWPAAAIGLVVLARVWWARSAPDLYFQQRNLEVTKAVLLGGLALGMWWLFLSRLRWRVRFAGVGLALAVLLLGAGLFRIRGVSGDLLPILEFRWGSATLITQVSERPGQSPTPNAPATTNGPWFDQFLGPQRNGVLAEPRLETNWTVHPPAVIWRRPVGPAWSGFAIAGDFAVTQEQNGEQECVTAYDLRTGHELWRHQYPARFQSTIAGEGPRATPTIAADRVLALGATGRLTCLELASGRLLWSADVLALTGSRLPDWGMASAPLAVSNLALVHAGDGARASLHAFSLGNGAPPVWSAGNARPGYASPVLAELSGAPQVLAFNLDQITAHDPTTGQVLWSHPWGNGNAVCSAPAVVDARHVLFSSGYGYGAELLEVTNRSGEISVARLWKSPRLKSKFGHLFIHDGCAMGLDDGVFCAVDLADGSLRWKDGRYGHGQGLLVGGLYLLMAESGELVLLRPTRDAANELGRFRVFPTKTWNPIALAGDFLLVRNDQEAACLRVALDRPAP